MKVADFNYQLPSELIAQTPPDKRSDSRLLMVKNDQSLVDAKVADIVSVLQPGDLLVLNNTKVIPARLFGQKDSGGKVEVLLERVLNEHEFLAQVRASRAPKIGQKISIDGELQVTLTVLAREGTFFKLAADQIGSLFDWFEQVGHMPLPPYIDRADNQQDQQRYQTVFAEVQGAVAAPTAGLHYDQQLLAALAEKGVNTATVTLHVGAGTYQPVRAENVHEHQMHSEYIDVDADVCAAIERTKRAGHRVIAVGTTVVRSLETAANQSRGARLEPYRGDTDIFIYPGYQFKVVDLLQTNFHLPESTLLMLVSAFSGYDTIMRAYQHAIEHRYRFFSYGDSMLLEPTDNC